MIYELFDRRVAKTLQDSVSVEHPNAEPGTSRRLLANAVQPSLAVLGETVLESHWARLKKKYRDATNLADVFSTFKVDWGAIWVPPPRSTPPSAPEPAPANPTQQSTPPQLEPTASSSPFTWPGTSPVAPRHAPGSRSDDVDELMDDEADKSGVDEDDLAVVSPFFYRTS